MAKSKRTTDQKEKALISDRSLNPYPGKVRSELFRKSAFFDPRDLVQVKYEMLREVEKDGISISKASENFGMSRPSYYQARNDFNSGGIPALAGDKRGPKYAHKVTDEIFQFVEKQMKKNACISSAMLSDAIFQHFQVKIHKRTIERAIKKNDRPR
jgi:transposase